MFNLDSFIRMRFKYNSLSLHFWQFHYWVYTIIAITIICANFKRLIYDIIKLSIAHCAQYLIILYTIYIYILQCIVQNILLNILIPTYI